MPSSDDIDDHLDEQDPKIRELGDWLNRTIAKIVAKYAGRVLWLIATVAFFAGVWATKLQMDIASLKEGQSSALSQVHGLRTTIEAMNLVQGQRLVDWSQWRVLKDAYDDNYERRLAWLETVERTRRP